MTSQALCREPQTPRLSRQHTLLVVEQNPVIQELLLYTFTLHGYHSVAVDREQIASLNWIENCIQTLPDGIVLDIDIQARTFQRSFDFMHAFCTHWYTATDHSLLPLVLLTTQRDTRDTLQQAGYSVVMKPFKLQDLLSSVKASIEQQQDRVSTTVDVAEMRIDGQEHEELRLAGLCSQ